ncbi:hypothetical protein GBA52_007693 [Prunus armeniaca]|nr:hypothetical protein GBA52_007693 [Prunus armeniaca]
MPTTWLSLQSKVGDLSTILILWLGCSSRLNSSLLPRYGMQWLDLIDVVNRPWNSDSLALLFSHEDQLVIKSISLSLKFPANRLIWHYNAKGSFTVKSAYHVAYSSLQDHCLTASTYVGGSNGYSHLWSTLWRANVPNEVKICVWRATLNILAARSNLVRRGVQIDQSCFLCNTPAETTLHTLRDCPFLNAVWFASSLGLCVSRREFTMKDWLCSVLDEVSLFDFNLVLMLIWAICKERNSHLWDGTRADPASVSL